MTHATTTIIAVKDAILTGLTEVAADTGSELHGVNIRWSHPGKRFEREQLWIGGTTSDDESFASIGNRQREERYRLELDLHVMEPGAEAEKVERRVAAMLGVVEQWLREHPDATITPGSIPGVGMVVCELVRADLKPFYTDNGRGAFFECDIGVIARI